MRTAPHRTSRRRGRRSFLQPAEGVAAAPRIAQPLEPPGDAGALAPLRLPTYRMFWAASLLSNIGTWVHEIGAGWLMSSLDGSAQMVAAVRAATALPMILLAIPSGALSDRSDRRRLLIAVQCLLIATACLMAVLTYLDRITPAGLLLLTVLMGLGTVLHIPTWQASIPEIVPRKHLPQAIALGSVSFNLARSVGPAIGGILIAVVGTWAAFGFNAVSFAVVLGAVILWKRPAAAPRSDESFLASMWTGAATALSLPELRRVLIRVILFVVPAGSLWALLPLVAREQLAWDARGYGYLVGAIGIGAVVAAARLPRMRLRIGVDATLAVSMLFYAGGLGLIALSGNKAVALVAAVMMGIGWMAVLTTLNATAQMHLPDEVRARGMACYLSTLAASMAVGAILWGYIAAAATPAAALAAAAAVLAASSWVCWAIRFTPRGE